MKKILFTNKCSAISADSSDPQYPASNLLTDSIGKLWKGTGYQGILTATVDANSSMISLHHTNAETIEVTVVDAISNSEVLWGPTVFTLKQGTDFLLGNMWCDYDIQTSAVDVLLVLTSDATEIIEAGIVRAGVPEVYADPVYGMKKTKVDKSIKITFRNGLDYYKKRDIVDRFTGEMMADDSSADDLLKQLTLRGEDPVSVLVTSLDADKGSVEDWAKWVKINPPEGSYDHKTVTRVPLIMEEVKQTLRRQV